MFYGVAVKAGSTVKLDSALGEVLHLSQACLSDPRDGGKTYLKLNDGANTFTVCCLQKDKCEHTAIDLFIQTDSDTVSFIAEGKNDVHLVGYWEPHSEETDDEHDPLGLLHDEAEDEVDEMHQLIGTGNHKIHKAAKIEDLDGLENLDESSEDEGDFIDSDDQYDMLDNGDESDDEDDEDEEAAKVVMQAKPMALPAGASANKQKPGKQSKPAAGGANNKNLPAGGKPQQQQTTKAPAKVGAKPQAPAAKPQAPAANEGGQKRKAGGEPAAQAPQAKQVKTATTPSPAGGAKPAAAADAGAESKFQQDLTDYLKKSGRTSISDLGSKVKKPAGVSKKLQAFLKDRSNIFKVDNNQVELIK